MKQLSILDQLEKKKRLEALWFNSDPLPWETSRRANTLSTPSKHSFLVIDKTRKRDKLLDNHFSGKPQLDERQAPNLLSFFDGEKYES